MVRSCSEVEKSLEKIALVAMENLGIFDAMKGGEPYMPEKEEYLKLAGLTQEEIYDIDIKPMLEESPVAERGHPIRVAIIEMPITRLLNFGQDARIEQYLVGTAHDLGKLKVKKYYPENNPYRRGSKSYLDYIEKFKLGHIAPENIPTHWGMRIASAIEQSHIHQKLKTGCGPYPAKICLPITEESTLQSKLVAIPDFLDGVTSRPDRVTGAYLLPSESIGKVMEEYGDLRIKYNGNLFPKVDISGAEIIQELQRAGFAGREKPAKVREEDFRMNPFVGLEIK